MSFDISNFFKKFWKQKHHNPDKDLYNDLINDRNNSNLESGNDSNNNENDEPPATSASNDNDTVEVALDHEQLISDIPNDSGNISIRYMIRNYDNALELEQLDSNGRISITQTADLNHDYLVQNPLVQKVITGTDDSDATILDITYYANNPICNGYTATTHPIVKAVNIDTINKTMQLTDAYEEETLVNLDHITIDPDSLNILFQGIDGTGCYHEVEIIYLNN